jgi:antitoxin component of MazEF toxin-antitoxin module
MNRKIIRIGNSYGVIIPKNTLKILDWDVKELEAKIDIKKGELVIKKGKK